MWENGFKILNLDFKVLERAAKCLQMGLLGWMTEFALLILPVGGEVSGGTQCAWWRNGHGDCMGKVDAKVGRFQKISEDFRSSGKMCAIPWSP